jgi:hypothetical protein
LGIHSFLQFEQIEKADRERILDALAVNAEYEKILSERMSEYQTLVHEAEHMAMERELRVSSGMTASHDQYV